MSHDLTRPAMQHRGQWLRMVWVLDWHSVSHVTSERWGGWGLRGWIRRRWQPFIAMGEFAKPGVAVERPKIIAAFGSSADRAHRKLGRRFRRRARRS